MNLKRTLLLVLAVALAACEKSATSPGDALSDSEAGALAAAILTLSLDAGLSEAEPAAAASGPAAAPPTFSRDVQLAGPCPLGGTMDVALHLDATFDGETEQGQLDIRSVAEHHACRVAAEDTGQLFTLDGAPRIEADFHLVTKPDQVYTLSGGYEGAVDWSTGDRSGTCHFDLEFSGTVDADTGAGHASLHGTACGATITYDVSG